MFRAQRDTEEVRESCTDGCTDHKEALKRPGRAAQTGVQGTKRRPRGSKLSPRGAQVDPRGAQEVPIWAQELASRAPKAVLKGKTAKTSKFKVRAVLQLECS